MANNLIPETKEATDCEPSELNLKNCLNLN